MRFILQLRDNLYAFCQKRRQRANVEDEILALDAMTDFWNRIVLNPKFPSKKTLQPTLFGVTINI